MNIDDFQSLPTVALPSGSLLTCIKQATAFVGNEDRHVVNSIPEEEAEQIDKELDEVYPQDFFLWGRCSR
jgi:hypothetical protein